MNVLILSNCPLVESQGSGYVILNTMKTLNKIGHTTRIVSPEEMMIADFMGNRAKVYRMALGMLKWAITNRSIIRDYDLILVYGAESYLAIYYLQKILKYKGKIIIHSNGIESHVDFRLNSFKKYLHFEKRWFHFDINRLYNYTYRNVDAIIVVSAYDKTFAVDHLKISDRKVFVDEPCLPELFFSKGEIVNAKEKIITFCGSWIDRKGIEAIKYSIPIVLNAYPDYQFRIIGTGPGFDKTSNFPKELIDRIDVIAHVEDKNKLIELYKQSSIFLFPSFCESFGLVVVEAMFCGCAVICGPTGVGAELINNVEAIVLDVPDNTNVLQALKKVIGDSSLRSLIAHNGQKKAQHLRWDTYASKLDSILKSVVEVN